MNIALLGGSFDPPHNGHLSIAEQLVKLLPINEVWLIPCFKHAFNKTLSPAKDRLAMTKLLANKRIKVSDNEIKRKNVSLTIETLDLFSKELPKHTFSWIIGDDQVPDFHKWDEWERIISDYGLIIVPRKKIKRDLPNFLSDQTNITYLPSEQWQISPVSSTDIRKRVKEGYSISQLVPSKVEQYIIVHGLYK